MTFKRQSSYYIINDIIPTTILVFAAYMTFWLAPDGKLTDLIIIACEYTIPIDSEILSLILFYLKVYRQPVVIYNVP